MQSERIPAPFLQFAADTLADTNTGLTGTNIVRASAAYAVDFDVELPHPAYPFDAPNKRTALYENLLAFSPGQQYQIINELCDHKSLSLKSTAARKDLKVKLVTRYSHLAEGTFSGSVNEILIEEARHWLEGYETASSLYSQALEKFHHGAFHRNLLDDLRLGLERLLRELFENQKPLEKQLPIVGKFIKESGGSPELSNMFMKLLDYYANYQNSYVKHDDKVVEEEIEFILEITSSFMKHLIRLREKDG